MKRRMSEDAVKSTKEAFAEAITSAGGECLVDDNWGVKTFAQPTEEGLRKGNFQYVLYRAPGTINKEVERRLNLNESVVKFLIIKLGDDSKQESLVKAYKNPNHSNVEGGEDGLSDKDKKMHAKRKSCWFSAKKTAPDWKDPKTYSWLVNEFGKISPARMTGLTPKFQRRACDAIKRGRMMGLISYMSNDIAR